PTRPAGPPGRERGPAGVTGDALRFVGMPTGQVLSTPPHQIVAEGLRFPEGPEFLPSGDLLVTEVRTGNVCRVDAGGRVSVAGTVDPTGDRGGANGAAIGPDGACYVTDNGGFRWGTLHGMELPFDPEGRGSAPDGFEGGRIARIDLDTGEVTTLYDSCDGRRFCGPNDLVFDGDGGFWFTDMGKDWGRTIDKGSLFYARADGSSVREVVHPLYTPNGVGLSPDGGTVYVAETITGRLLAWDLDAPGSVIS